MNVLVDTNVLMRSAEPTHVMHPAAIASAAILLGQGDRLCLAPQNLYEFWVASTRPKEQNGLGFDAGRAEGELARLKTQFAILGDSPAVLAQWENLIVKYQVIDKNAHDTRLVAAMIVHGIPRILTFNTADFQRYQEITAIAPADLLNAPAKGSTP
jgi:predicted nucleic acid-binding protein